MEALVNIADLVVAATVGGVLLIGASLTGQNETLCRAIDGTYQPQASDVCPDGNWSALVGLEATPKPSTKGQ